MAHSDLLIRYVTQLVDNGTKALLQSNDQLQKKLTGTDRALKGQATQSKKASDAAAAMATVAERAGRAQANAMDAAAKSVAGLSKQTAALGKALPAGKLQQDVAGFGKIVGQVQRGEKSIQDATTALTRMGTELDKASRKQAIGSRASEDLAAAARTAREAAAGVRTLAGAQRDGARATVALTADARKLAQAQEAERRAELNAAHAAEQRTQTIRAQRTQLAALVREQAKVASTKVGAAASSATGAATGAAGGLASRAGGLAATAGLGLGAAGIVKTAVSFEQGMANVNGRLQTTRKEMAGLSDLAIEMGSKTQFSAREAAGAMDELAAAGFTAKEIYNVLPGTLSLAAASGTDLASSAAIQAAALRGFGLAAGDAGHVADVLAQTVNQSASSMEDLGVALPYVASTARMTGTSFEQVAAMAGLLGNAGIAASSIGTSLRTSMLRLTDPSKKMSEMLGSVGLRAKDLAATPLPNVLGKIAGAIKGLPRGQQVGIVSAVFGKESAPSILNLLAKGRGEIDRMTRALQNSDGAAKKSADIMRNTTAGAWDNFTGSVESASIKLTQRFMPSLKGALNMLAGKVDKAPGTIGGFLAGLGGQATPGLTVTRRSTADRTAGMGGPSQTRAPAGPARPQARGFGGPSAAARNPRVSAVQVKENTAQALGRKVRDVTLDAFEGAKDLGKQLVAALKPAMPFLENVLLPLLEGVGKGILGSVVGAIKVLIPIIGVAAKALGWIGTKLAPLKPAFEKVGEVIGFVAGGPILRFIGGLGKLGKLGAVFRALAKPVELLGSIFGKAFGGVGKLAGALGPRIGALLGKIPGIAGAALGGLVGVLKRVAARALGANIDGLKLLWTRVPGVLKELPGKAMSVLGGLVSAFGRIGSGIVGAIVAGIKKAPGAIVNALGSLIPGKLKGLASHIPGDPFGLKPDKKRRGGLIRRFQAGGLVDVAVSPGEQVVHGDRSWTVPGAPTAADSVYTRLPVGAAVLTGDGQARMAAGASLAETLATQAPHFREGGVVPGSYTSTSYGPPWTGINGTGVTKTGVNLKGRPHVYGVASDPSMVPLGSSPYIWPNPFRYTGRFKAFDTGSAIQGRRLDFYDWRGRGPQMKWGRKDVTVSNAPIHGAADGRNTYNAGGGAQGATAQFRVLGRSRTRAGLLDDAMAQGVSAGESGLTRSEIRRANRGVRGARSNPILASVADQISALNPAGGNVASRRGAAGKGSAKISTTGVSGHPELKSAISRLTATVMGWYPSARISSTTGGTHAKNSLHKAGRAVDLVLGNVRNMGFAARRVAKDLRGRLAEGIFNTGLSVKNGKTVPPSFWGARTWADHKDHLHLAARRGGRIARGSIQRFAAGGTVGRTLQKAVNRSQTFAGGSFAALDDAIGAATSARIEALRRQILAQVREGGPATVIRRLQGTLDLIDGEIGRRIGRINSVIDTRTEQRDRGQTKFDRAQRTAGIDPSSAAGLAGQIGQDALAIKVGERNTRSARSGLDRAKRTGNAEQIAAQLQRLRDAQDYLAEATVKQIEDQRAQIAAAAQDAADRSQELVDRAQRGVDSSTIDTTGLEISQRVAGTTDTAGGMVERARAITASTVPALATLRDAFVDQAKRLAGAGDVQGAEQAANSARSATNDMASAMADAADLVKQSAETLAQQLTDAAQAVADDAQRRVDLVGAETSYLDITQRTRGTADTAGGMVERAQAITGQLVPALQDRFTAIQGQYVTALNQGDSKGADAAYLSAKQAFNDIASAVADSADLMREAVQRAAQDLVDSAQHTTTMAQGGLNLLQLQQQLGHTDQSAGAKLEQANYIRSQILPALQAELIAVQKQQADAQAQGDPLLARQIAEQLQAKQADVMQAQLDAQERTAEASELTASQFREATGTLAFDSRGQQSLDSIFIGL